MREVSRFFGIIIRFYYNDHEPAHFHAGTGTRPRVGSNASHGTSDELGNGTTGRTAVSNRAIRLEEEGA